MSQNSTAGMVMIAIILSAMAVIVTSLILGYPMFAIVAIPVVFSCFCCLALMAP